MDQHSLFPADNEHVLDLEGFGSLEYYPSWLSVAEADRYFDVLNRDIVWDQPEISVYGKRHVIPRLQAWYGDQCTEMAYSGIRLAPKPWIRTLGELKTKIAHETGATYNSVLVNLCRGGQDSVGWHADDEQELGHEPVIASLSLGSSRIFSLKPKSSTLPNGALKRRDMTLNHGDLLVMSAGTQSYWHHALLKDKACTMPRLNLTFRHIQNI